MAERLSEVLVKAGCMTPVQVEVVLSAQRAGDKRSFGTIALALGFLDDDALRRCADYLDQHAETEY
jgi:hypothetical protein